MSDYKIICNMDANDIMNCLSTSEEVGFVHDCYDYLGAYQRRDFLEMLGVEEVIEFFNDEEIVEHLGDEALIEELIGRGYNITQDGSEDI